MRRRIKLNIPTKLPHIGTTIFAVMSKLANEHNALNLSQGFPDFDCDPALVRLVEKYLRLGHNQYAPMTGLQVLRERVVEKVENSYHAAYDPELEINITPGATAALFSAITAVVHPGDEVILFEPAYDSYVPAIQLSGGTPVYVKMEFPDYRINWQDVADKITSRTRMIILNSPHNPTGTILHEDDIAALTALVTKTDILLLSDEVYEHIIFDGQEHLSLCSYPQLRERAFVVSSFGKTFHTTGWKTGYCLAPAELMAAFRKVYQFVVYTCNTPVQHAYAEFLGNTDAIATLAGFYQQKRDLFLNALQNSRFKALPCDGTYFSMLDYSAISDEPDYDMARHLTIEHGVAAIPPSVFYAEQDDHKVLRFCFAKRDETLKHATEILCAI